MSRKKKQIDGVDVMDFLWLLRQALNEESEDNCFSSAKWTISDDGDGFEITFPDMETLCGVSASGVGEVVEKYGFYATLNGYGGSFAIHLWPTAASNLVKPTSKEAAQ